jgi:lipopolysaccharide transport system ATP-binding protein
LPVLDAKDPGSVIELDSICKTYQVWSSPTSRLLVPLAHRVLRPFAQAWYQRTYERHCTEVVALNNVSFSLSQGDSLGVIGLNGSGKSTLLQIVAGTLRQTSGEVATEGRVAALLELGSGFDPEFTGKENVYLNAAILGLTAEETAARYDDIVKFADIGESIDRAVKTYSTGMLVRLAFAVQVHVEPDILIVDEALAVGDARFQARALNKLEWILGQGTSLLFVGHDLNTVRSFCNRGMLLDQGNVLYEGIPDDVIAKYQQLVQTTQGETRREASEVHKGFSIDNYCVLEANIVSFGSHAELTYAASIVISAVLQLGDSASSPYLILDIVDQKGLQLTGRRIKIPRDQSLQRDKEVVEIGMDCCFQRGIYRIRLRIVDAPTLDQSQLLSRQDDLVSFEMVEDVRSKFTGIFPVPMNVKWL